MTNEELLNLVEICRTEQETFNARLASIENLMFEVRKLHNELLERHNIVNGLNRDIKQTQYKLDKIGRILTNKENNDG